MIYIYKDKGVSPRLLKELESLFNEYLSAECTFINAKDVRDGLWQRDCNLFVMPGGRDIPYHASLKGAGVEKIKSYVELGGNYLGICAGAYFASKEIVFEKGTSLEIIANRDLGFFSGIAMGCVIKDPPFLYGSEKGASAPSIKYQNKRVALYYNGGCTFIGSDGDVLASFEDNQPAIILLKAKKGRVVLSGVHFEVSEEYSRLTDELRKKITKDKKSRACLIEDIFSFLGLIK